MAVLYVHSPTNSCSADKLKSRLEKHRISRGIQGPTDASAQADQREEELIGQLESEKAKSVGDTPPLS